MTFVVRRMMSDRLIVITVSGDVSVDSALRLRTVLTAAVDSGRPVVVDMVEVTFIDRVGFAVLAAAHRQAHEAGTSLLLRTAPAQIPRLIAPRGVDPAAASGPSCSNDREAVGPVPRTGSDTLCP